MPPILVLLMVDMYQMGKWSMDDFVGCTNMDDKWIVLLLGWESWVVLVVVECIVAFIRRLFDTMVVVMVEGSRIVAQMD